MAGSRNHIWHFIQTGGLTQLKISSIDDVLNLGELDPKLWIALACPVKGLEFSEETLSLLDLDKDGRVRVPEVLEAVSYIKKYFKRPELIMSEGDSIPLDALGDEPFDCGHSPYDSALSVLKIVGKEAATEITLDDVSVHDKLFSPSVINGDKILTAESVEDEFSASVVKDIIACTGGSDDISGVKGVERGQFEKFFGDLRSTKVWREGSKENASDIFFLQFDTDSAAAAYMKVYDKVSEYFLRCSLSSYDAEISGSIKKLEDESLAAGEMPSCEQLARLPLAAISTAGLPLCSGINPAWCSEMEGFVKSVVEPLFGAGKTLLLESEWKEIEAKFKPYMDWYNSRPETCVSSLSFERMEEILSSDAEALISSFLEKEENHPPIALATLELRKMILYRRDFVELLKNYVSFENFYSFDDWAVFQCGTLYIDGRSCDLCFKVIDSAKHATMSPLSQCYLLYCTCTRVATGEKMEIAAMVSAGSRDNFIVGRNGLFYDRKGQDWDATITKIVENPISIREAFWSPYKKLVRMVQERLAKTASDAEAGVMTKMSAAVDNPTDVTNAAKGVATGTKKIDVGTIAAISVAFTGIATVVGGLLQAFLGLGWWIPLGIVGLVLIISLPSMFIAWSKLRQRNIAPILDASGWAINGNAKINIPLGALLTSVAVRPKNSRLDTYDPYKQKGFPIKRTVFFLVVLALLVCAVVVTAKNGWNVFKAWASVKGFFTGLFALPSEG